MEKQDRFMTNAEVCELLGISRETLRKMMSSTPDDYGNRPWVTLGTPRRPRYRWGIEGLAAWAERTSGWREQLRKNNEKKGGLRATGRSPLLSV